MVERLSISARTVRYLIRLSIQLPVFLALYVLSIGPMFWYWYEARFLNGSTFIAKLYYPLLLACENEMVRYYINRYIDWWIQ